MTTDVGRGSMVSEEVMMGDPSRISAMTVHVPLKEVSEGSEAGFRLIPQEELALESHTESEREL